MVWFRTCRTFLLVQNDIWRRREDTVGGGYTRPQPNSNVSTPRSDRDSAFSESPTSSERGYVIKRSPPLVAGAERCSSSHTHSTRFVTSQSRQSRWLNNGCDARSNQNEERCWTKKTHAPSSGCSRRTTAPSRNSSYNRSVRARAVIKALEDRIAIGYFVQCVIRLLLETAFLVLQYLMFDFQVPELFQCERWPCPHVVRWLYCNLKYLSKIQCDLMIYWYFVASPKEVAWMKQNLCCWYKANMW